MMTANDKAIFLNILAMTGLYAIQPSAIQHMGGTVILFQHETETSRLDKREEVSVIDQLTVSCLQGM